MPGELDAISLAIGRLEQGQRQAEQDRQSIRDEFKSFNTNVASLTLAVSTANATLETLKPQVEQWVEKSKKAQWFGLGVLSVAGLAGGAMGAKALAILGLLTGTGGK